MDNEKATNRAGGGEEREEGVGTRKTQAGEIKLERKERWAEKEEKEEEFISCNRAVLKDAEAAKQAGEGASAIGEGSCERLEYQTEAPAKAKPRLLCTPDSLI